MKKLLILSLVLAGLVSTGCMKRYPEKVEDPEGQADRTFTFTYEVTLKDLPEKAKSVKVWLPVAQDNAYQKITDVKVEGLKDHKMGREKTYGNKFLYGEIDLTKDRKKTYTITMSLVCARKKVEMAKNLVKESKDLDLYLKSQSKVPVGSEKIGKIVPEKVKKESDLTSKARQVYDLLLERMKYDKPKDGGWGRGDAEWACDSKYGNCTDFHSLFNSIMRTEKVPAQFVIGFPLPAEKSTDKPGTIGGYHCWAWFYEKDKGWIPVDISEADKHPEKKEFFFGNLDADRITFSRGRDIQLPESKNGPVNFIVYPVVEIDGRRIGKKSMSKHVAKKFTYQDKK